MTVHLVCLVYLPKKHNMILQLLNDYYIVRCIYTPFIKISNQCSRTLQIFILVFFWNRSRKSKCLDTGWHRDALFDEELVCKYLCSEESWLLSAHILQVQSSSIKCSLMLQSSHFQRRFQTLWYKILGVKCILGLIHWVVHPQWIRWIRLYPQCTPLMNWTHSKI